MGLVLVLSCSNSFSRTHLLYILKSIIWIYKLPNILFHLQYFVTLACAAVVSVHVKSVFELLQVAVFHFLVLVDEVVVFGVLPDVLPTNTIVLHLNQKLLMRRHVSIYKVLC
jgi:hypothetical protein